MASGYDLRYIARQIVRILALERGEGQETGVREGSRPTVSHDARWSGPLAWHQHDESVVVLTRRPHMQNPPVPEPSNPNGYEAYPSAPSAGGPTPWAVSRYWL